MFYKKTLTLKQTKKQFTANYFKWLLIKVNKLLRTLYVREIRHLIPMIELRNSRYSDASNFMHIHRESIYRRFAL